MAELKKDAVNFGFGFMRLPRLEDGKTIDIEQTKKMVDVFMSKGFVYFDTAYAYEGSEEALRKSLIERYPRDSFLLATKLSMKTTMTKEEAENLINTSLTRLGTDHVDYYLLHNLSGDRIDYCEENGLWDYVKELKAQGKIRHYGFSFHDTPEKLDEILSKHPEAEFVQLQINYYDWENPDVQSRRCYEIAKKYNKMLIVMEPVKGGSLANALPQSVQDLLSKANPEASFASWALRFVASQPGVNIILSGMSTLEQVEDNVSFMSEIKPLTEEEQQIIVEARNTLNSIPLIQCTACEYCLKGCPMSIPTPRIFKVVNNNTLFPDINNAKRSYERVTSEGGKASQCVGCGMCEESCPQHLPIRELLSNAAELFE
jgi:hypothetical protein